MDHDSLQIVINLLLSGSKQAPIKKLTGFKSFHNVPTSITTSSREFVKTCATPQIEQELEELWTTCRQEFGYKRLDKISASVEGGIGTLVLKDFRFQLSVEQDPEDPSSVIWRRAVDEIKNPQILLELPFNRTFAQAFDSIEAPFPVPQDMEAIIDRLEGLEAQNIALEYPTDCSRCTVTLRDLGLVVEITSDSYRIKYHGHALPNDLCERIFAFQKAIMAAGPENLLFFAESGD